MGDRKTKAVSAGGADRAAVIPSPTAQPAKRSELMLLTHLALETLTDQVMKEWAKGKAPPSSIKSLYQKEAESCVKDEEFECGQHPFRRLLLEMLGRVVSGHLNHDLLVPFLESLLKDLSGGESKRDRFFEVLCDAFSVAFTTTPADKQAPLSSLARALVDKEVVPLRTTRALLPEELLHSSQLIPDETKFKISLRKTNTTRVYRQTKFNLLHEETEGYAKLLTALHQLSAATTPAEGIVEHVVSLIGYFDLDPNRVCDMTLEAFERAPGNLAFLKVLSRFKRDYIPHILGFKFRQHLAWDPARPSADPKDKDQNPDKPPTPTSLYMLAALLLSSGLMDFRLFLPHLKPDHKALMERQELDNATLQVIASVQQGTDKVLPIPKLLMEETDAQVLGVLQAILELKDWAKASEVMDVLEAHGINACFHGGVRKALLNLVHHMIEPVYAGISPKNKMELLNPSKASAPDGHEPIVSPNAIPQITELPGLDEALLPMLKRLDLHTAHDILLMTKILRLFREFHRKMATPWDESTFPKSALATILGRHMLPSLALIEVNPGLLHEFWDVLQRFPWRWRYTLYTTWRDRGKHKRVKDVCPLLAAYEQRGMVHLRYVARRISSEPDKEVFRKCSRLTVRFPLQTFEYMIQLAEKNDNYIPYYIDNYRASPAFSMDVLSFALLLRVGGETRRRFSKKSKAHEVPWVKALANFTGQLYRKYPFTEVAGLLEFIIQQLRAKSSVDLLVFHELLSRMGNNPSFEEGLTDTMIRGRGGGEILKAETALFGSKDRVPKKSIARLREVLLSRNMGLPLLLLLARQRSFILFDDEIEVAMIIGTLYDKCNMVFLQFVEFISNGAGPLPHKYASLVPSFEELVNKLNLDPEIAFHVTRPLSRATIKRSLDPSRADHYVDDGSKVVELNKTWYPFTPEAEAAVKQTLPPNTWDSITPTFYLMFWSFSLYDVDVPESVYQDEIKRLQGTIKELHRVVNQDTVAMDGLQVGSREREKERERKKKEIKEAEANIKALEAEHKAQKEHCQRVRENLIKFLMFKLFPPLHESDAQGGAANLIVQHCILPRAVLSPEDALYTAKFLHLLHSMEVPNYPILKILDLVFREASTNLFACTEQEAYNMGIFFRDLMVPLRAWADSRVTFEQEASKIGAYSSSKEESISFEKYSRVHNLWDKRMVKICTSAIGNSLKSEAKPDPDILTIKGAVRFLVNVLDVFPYSKYHGEQLLKSANQLHASSQSNPDLAGIQSLIQGYIMRLTPKVETLKEVGRKEPPQGASDASRRDGKAASKSMSPATHGTSTAGGSLAVSVKRGGSAEKSTGSGGATIGGKRKRDDGNKDEEEKPKKALNGAAAPFAPSSPPSKRAPASGGSGPGPARAVSNTDAKGGVAPVKQEPNAASPAPAKARTSAANLPPPPPRKEGLQQEKERGKEKEKDDPSISSGKKTGGDEKSDAGRKERDSSKSREVGPAPAGKKDGGAAKKDGDDKEKEKGKPTTAHGDSEKDKKDSREREKDKDKDKERDREKRRGDGGPQPQGSSGDGKSDRRSSKESPSKSSSRARSHERGSSNSHNRRGEGTRSHSGDRTSASRGGGGGGPNSAFGTFNVPSRDREQEREKEREVEGGRGHLGKRGRSEEATEKEDGDRGRGGSKKSKNEGGARGGRVEDRSMKGPPMPPRDIRKGGRK